MPQHQFKTALVFFLLIFINACTSQASKDLQELEQHSKRNFETGKLIAKIQLDNNTAHSFALYLPQKYSTTQRIPLLIFFDPHAEGAYTIEHYTDLAEKYDCILAASNDSKNGMQVEETNAIVDELMIDLKNKLAVDTTKIMVCGFSGGAKVAICGALQMNEISKVVYCGAALPFENCNHPLQMLGFAGLKDMNYSDVVSFSQNNFPQTVKNYCVEWNGKHEWPDEKTFEQVFYFLNNNFEKLQLIKLNEQKKKLLQQEQNIHQQYISALQTKVVSYWKSEINKLNQADNTGLNERLKGFVSLACYSFSNQLLQQNELQQAEKILTIYKLADPSNADADLFSAILFAKQNDKQKMFTALHSATKNGLNDFTKIENESSFSIYLQTPEIQKIRSEIQTRKK